MEEIYTDKKFWDNYFDKHDRRPSIVTGSLFSGVFDRHLTPNPHKTILEIGCANSNFLCYLAKKFGYQAYGIDYSDAVTKTAELFKFNNLPEPLLYKEDFLKWHNNKKFDIVCSFGFLEHFKNIDRIVAKHADLIVPGGKLIITIPHFAHAQYFLHWLIDRENLKKHNTKIMNLPALKMAVENNNLKIEFLSYYKTFGFWTENNQMSKIEKIINWLIIKSGKIVTKIFGYDKPNFLFSPHIVCVATKNEHPSDQYN